MFLEANNIKITENKEGGLLLHAGDTKWEIGNITAAFPLSNPGNMIVFKDTEGDEIGIVKNLSGVDKNTRKWIKEELEKSYFMPIIKDILDVEEKLRVVTMHVETNRGERTFQVRNVRQNLRKIGNGRIIIKDVDGNRFQIKRVDKLSDRSQRLLAEYL